MARTSSVSARDLRVRTRWNGVLWVAQWVLAAAMVGGGAFKLSLSVGGAAEMFPWAGEHPTLFVVTSTLDIIGGLGLVVPTLTKIFPWLTWLAATGVFALMASAIVFHLARGEAGVITTNIALALIAAFIAWGRFRCAPIVKQVPQPTPFSGPLPVAHPPADMRIAQLPTGTYTTPAALAIRGGSFRDQREFAATAILIQHPQGDLLIDAGFGKGANAHISSLPSYRQSPHTLLPTVSEQLDAASYERARLLGVLVTHTHWDHVSGLDSLDLPIWITEPELAYASTAKDDRVFSRVAAQHDKKTYAFDGLPYLGFPSSHDFYGDGSVVIVPATGHTSGSVIVFVATPQEKRYAFIGDLTWQIDGITDRVERPLLMQRLADSDPGKIRGDLTRIIALADRYQIVPSHDLASYTGIPTLTEHR